MDIDLDLGVVIAWEAKNEPHGYIFLAGETQIRHFKSNQEALDYFPNILFDTTGYKLLNHTHCMGCLKELFISDEETFDDEGNISHKCAKCNTVFPLFHFHFED